VATLVLGYAGSMITQTTPLNILLVDDAPSVRQALRWLLEEVPGFQVVGEAADGDTAVQLCQNLLPDVVVLDIDLPHKKGFRVTRLLKETMPQIQIIVLSGHGDTATRQLAVDVGADGFVEKSDGWQALLAELEGVAISQIRDAD
jgi:DNA-binding NarL/FixJ family response regulator